MARIRHRAAMVTAAITAMAAIPARQSRIDPAETHRGYSRPSPPPKPLKPKGGPKRSPKPRAPRASDI